MINLESDKMTALWPDDSLTFTFYVAFSYSIPNWTTFVQDFFDLILISEIDQKITLLRDEFRAEL